MLCGIAKIRLIKHLGMTQTISGMRPSIDFNGKLEGCVLKSLTEETSFPLNVEIFIKLELPYGEFIRDDIKVGVPCNIHVSSEIRGYCTIIALCGSEKCQL